MGPRHSKRSLDMAGTPTKGEIEGVGNAGKLEKIVDGIVEKVSANGHVDGEIENGAEAVQNGLENMQNGEAAVIAVEYSLEKINLEEKDTDEAVVRANGDMEEKLRGETEEKVAELEAKEEKKEKKKDKKEKVVKKKFSFRSFSFSKKDKSKPPKDEKVTDAKEKIGIEETPEVVAEVESEKVDEAKDPIAESAIRVAETTSEVGGKEAKENVATDPAPAPAVTETTSDATATESAAREVTEAPVRDDLPPPLPASPPPSEKDETPMESEESAKGEGDSTSTSEVLTASELIEEKATDLLKAVEEKAEESKRNEVEKAGGEASADATGGSDEIPAEKVAQVKGDSSKMDMEANTEAKGTEQKTGESLPEALSNVVTLSPNAEDATDKQEEFGAGESLAEIDTAPEEIPATNEVAVVE